MLVAGNVLIERGMVGFGGKYVCSLLILITIFMLQIIVTRLAASGILMKTPTGEVFLRRNSENKVFFAIYAVEDLGGKGAFSLSFRKMTSCHYTPP
jgi:hypothetical protein